MRSYNISFIIIAFVVATICTFTIFASAIELKDVLVKAENPRAQIDLSGLSKESSYNMDKLNPELSKNPRWELPDYGYYYSGTVIVKQNNSKVTTDAIREFINSSEKIPNSVGNKNNSINYTVINGSSEIPPYY